ncbi:hypothetical protein KKA08_10810 [bacterium]|nr:hypothetical protein [bacterium]
MFSRNSKKEHRQKLIPLPDQVIRLLVVMVLIVVVFVSIRGYFIPPTFGELGHYRAVAIDSVASQTIHYAGHLVCAECHDDIVEAKEDSYHRHINCESCHGPSWDHIDSGGDTTPHVPRAREHCLLCHVYNAAKPSGFPQIDPVMHNPVKPCIACHDPHAPEPPEALNGCSACHGNIYRTKALSPHAPLACSDCHTTTDEHSANPRIITASKPANRADCTRCHAQGSAGDRFIPRIDAETHGENYLCWECHYPHFPEAK